MDTLFTIYFSNALQQLKEEMGKDPIDIRDINPQLTEITNSNLPDEMVKADDCNFMTEFEQKKERIHQKTKTILTNKNLLVNEDKTKNTTIKRKETETEEEWKNVIKLGSKLGEREDIKRGKNYQTLHYQITT